MKTVFYGQTPTQSDSLLKYIEEGLQNEFPIWMAFDRHTTYGAEAIIEAARSIGVNMSLAQWLTFYQEGSKCSDLTPSPWWNRYLECGYYLHRITPSEAENTWYGLLPIRQELLKDGVEFIKNVLARCVPQEELQLSLF
jgi:hypothetical protein